MAQECELYRRWAVHTSICDLPGLSVDQTAV